MHDTQLGPLSIVAKPTGTFSLNPRTAALPTVSSNLEEGRQRPSKYMRLLLPLHAEG